MLAIAAVVLATYWPALHANALSFDDGDYLVDNRLVRHPSWSSAARFLTEVLEPSTVHGYYQPLTMISLMLDSAAGGTPEDLLPFHRTSLALHVLNTMLIVLILYHLFGSIWAAALVGLLFGVHPLTVEPIPWVGERKTLLAAVFSLGSILAYLRYARSSSRVAYAACLALYVLSLLSKPTGTMLPLALLLLDYWPLSRLRWRTVLEKAPLLAIALASAAVTYESQRRTATAIGPAAWGDPLRVPYIICHNNIFYLCKLVWPAQLSSEYTFPSPLNLSSPSVLIGVVGTLLLLVLLIVSLRWTRALLTGWLIFFVIVFPTLGVIGFTHVIASDKYVYLPALGMLLLAAALLQRLLDAHSRARWLPAAVACGGGLLTIAAVLATRTYLHKWRDTETLYRHMLYFAPQAANVHNDLGLELKRQGRLPEAMVEFRTASELMPEFWAGYFNIGAVLLERGQAAEAVGYFRRAVVGGNPKLAATHNSLGSALLELGQQEPAMAEYAEAIRLEPHYADARYNLANVLAARGQPDQAVDMYEQVLTEVPEHAAAHKNLAAVLLSQNKLAAALEHYRLALHYRPDWWDVTRLLAFTAATSDDPAVRNPAEGVRLAEQAVRLTGGREPGVLGTLAICYGEAGRRELAEQTARQAIAGAVATSQPGIAADIEARMRKYSPAFSSRPAETP